MGLGRSRAVVEAEIGLLKLLFVQFTGRTAQLDHATAQHIDPIGGIKRALGRAMIS